MIGRTVSHYRIISVLGTGGMGVVYRAEDITLGRHVAIKFLAPHLSADATARHRFIHEAKAAANLEHSGICTVYDFGESEDQLFITMALLEGETLKDRLAKGPLPLSLALAVAMQVAEALQAAHTRGVVHRDIKPANIMLTPDGHAKVMDFGLAQQPGATQLTQAGSTMGTAAYMSPEQARGEAVDHRTDIWSLGAVLYEMISGQRPFAGDQPAALMYAIQHHEPTPLTALRSGVPLEVERIVGKCLAKDEGQRYQHADEFLADRRRLEANLDTTRTLAVPGRVHRSRRRAIAAVLIATGILGGGLWLTLGRTGGDQREFTLAIMDFQDIAETDEVRAAACLTQLVQTGMVEKCPVRVLSPEYVQEIQRHLFGESGGMIQTDQALRIAREAGATLLLTGSFSRTGEIQFVSWRLVETMNGRSLAANRMDQPDLFKAADGIIAEAVPAIAKRADLNPRLASGSVENITTGSAEAYRHYLQGLKAMDRGDGQSAHREFGAATTADTTFALAYLELARNAYYFLSNQALADSCAQRAWRHRDHLSVRDRMSLEARRSLLALRYKEAWATYDEVLRRWPDDRASLREVAQLKFNHMEYAALTRLTSQGLLLYPGDRVLMKYRILAMCFTGQPEAALAESRAWSRAAPQEAWAWNNVGEAFLAMGEPDSAEVALKVAQSIEPTNDTMFGLDLARCSFARGNAKQAIDICLDLLNDPALPPDQRRIALYVGDSGCSNLTQFYAATGQIHAAIRAWDDYIAKRPSAAEKLSAVRGKLSWLCELATREDVPQWIVAVAQDTLASPFARDLARAFADSATGAEGVRLRLAQLPPLPANETGGMQVGRQIVRTRLFCALGEADSAVASADFAWRWCPNYNINWTWRWRVKALRMGGRFEEAANTLESALRIRRGEYIAHYWLGRTYEDLGRRRDAAAQYRIFLELWKDADPEWPHPADARRRLAAL